MSIEKSFNISLGTHWLSGFTHNFKTLCIQLGEWESEIFAKKIKDITIKYPIYISGLARSGSTLLLEIIASHAQIASHQYKHFPLLHAPIFWHKLYPIISKSSDKRTERAQADGIFVSPNSPEAMEEILWMAFFKDSHNPTTPNILNGLTQQLAFEPFYQDHIRKILYLQQRQRYVAKGNYNITRMEYLLKIFPNARFVIPIRHPESHVASLVRQHILFSELSKKNRYVQAHLQRVGHFEFGPNRIPINAGDTDFTHEINTLWQSGNEVAGWACYWKHIYGYVLQRIQQNKKLAQACLVLRFEDLCDHPKQMLHRLFEHCQLDHFTEIVNCYQNKIRTPQYYNNHFSSLEKETIRKKSFDVAYEFGYYSGTT